MRGLISNTQSWFITGLIVGASLEEWQWAKSHPTASMVGAVCVSIMMVWWHWKTSPKESS